MRFFTDFLYWLNYKIKLSYRFWFSSVWGFHKHLINLIIMVEPDSYTTVLSNQGKIVRKCDFSQIRYNLLTYQINLSYRFWFPSIWGFHKRLLNLIIMVEPDSYTTVLSNLGKIVRKNDFSQICYQTGTRFWLFTQSRNTGIALTIIL